MADWSIGVLAPDGFIYCVPDTATEVLRYDPKTRETLFFGKGEISVGTHKWSDGIIAPNGCIYCVPWTHPQVMVIDPDASSVSFIDTATEDGTKVASFAEHKWRDGILASDGCIYCIPWAAEAILRIDPEARTAICFGKLPEGDSKWAGAVLADDGRIYCAPYDARSILCIDVERQMAVCLGDFGPARRKYRGALKAENGKIYMVPYNALEVLLLDPSEVKQAVEASLVDAQTSGNLDATAQALGAAKRAALKASLEDDDEGILEDTTAASKPEGLKAGGVVGCHLFGWVGGIRCKWRSGVMVHGRIYCVPDCSSQVLYIDPAKQDVVLFGHVGLGKWKWRGGVLASDGKIYCAPYEPHEKALCIDPVKHTTSLSKEAFDGGGLRLPGFIETVDKVIFTVPLT